MKNFLVIQTAFIGDVILATAVLEKLHLFYPHAKIDFLVRQGNEGLLEKHPFLNDVLVWYKKENKYKNLLKLSNTIRQTKYDCVVNLQRHAGSGFLTWRSGSKIRIGFNKNPLSFLFTEKYPHVIGNGLHEVERNQLLIEKITDQKFSTPKLYPTQLNFKKIEALKLNVDYIVIAPSSVWFTKQIPKTKIIELINLQAKDMQICLIGAPSDFDYCESILNAVSNPNVKNLANTLSLLDSAALIKNAKMNYVNDSAPLHICSAMNAPVKTFFCSTIPKFGFGPLSTNSEVLENNLDLTCRPCGIHGHKVCPKGHFKCGDIILNSN